MDYKYIIKRSSVVLLVLFTFFLPVWIDIAILILPFLILSGFLSCSWTNVWKRLLSNRFAVLMILFWLLHLIGVLYSQKKGYAFNDVQQKLSLIVFPLFFVLLADMAKANYNRILNTFVIGCFASMLICLINALVQSLSFNSGTLVFNPHPAEFPWENNFIYHRLAFLYHPTYLAMYISFAMVILFNKIKSTKGIRVKLLIILGIVSCYVFIFFLSSRAGIMIGFLAGLIGFIGLFKNWKAFVKWGGLIVAILFVALLINYFVDNSYSRKLADTFIYENNMRNLDYSKTQDSRIGIWRAILPLVAERPLFGYGTGDSHEVLNEAYRKNNMDYEADNNYNAHNQYFETSIAIGLFGLFILLLILFYPLFHFIKSTNFVLPFAFIVLVATNFALESMAARVMGVMFFAFFYSLFFCSGVFNTTKEI